MSKVVPISREEHRLEAASRWVLRMDEGLSGEDEAALQRWLAEHPRNSAELVEVAQAWDKLDCLSRLADVFPIDQAISHRRPMRSSGHSGWLAAGWLAATACAAALIAGAWLIAPERDSFEPVPRPLAAQNPVTYETAVGERRTVTLTDDTAVTLNTNSRVSVQYSGSGRLLELLRGEIHVHVAPDPARPFSVLAGETIVQAVGTAFTVELTASHEVELVVTEGTVTVGMRPPLGDAGPARVDPGPRPALPPRTVPAGHELIMRAAEEVVVPVSPEDLEIRLAWRDGRLIFRDEPLEQAIAEIERYTTVDFVFVDESLRQQAISGRYKTGDVESLLLALRANFGIGYQFDGEDRVLLRSL